MAEKSKITDVVKNGIDNIKVETVSVADKALAAVAAELGVKIEDGKTPLASKAIADKPSKGPKVSTLNGLTIEER